MRILITGVNGFVGRNLFHFFGNRGDLVWGTYRSGAAINDQCYKADLVNEEDTYRLFNVILKNKIDVIIHTASVLAGAGNLKDLSVIFDNAKMAKNISEAIQKTSIKQLINFSSSSVYPNAGGTFSEDSELDPSKNTDCFYGLSKLNVETIFNYLLEGTNIAVLHLRVGVIYGQGMNTSRLIPILEEELKQKNTMTLYANGERFINQIKIEKLCEYVRRFAEKGAFGIFNVSDEFITAKEIARRILEEKGNEASKIILLSQGNRSNFKLDITKLKKWLND
ncbi:NAD-dependent epimerase/dehydratase family protein [Parapedobacter lycopersici]|uniref:NAD-dependent epimerase/dehydratase family protein n=1 Tax=Parapedobacter lycopersici TaxID=1864939 RepID=UPI00214DBE14|nr:NAD(P)-dependent oxidoreductase [Parapedobacter lycopersici]